MRRSHGSQGMVRARFSPAVMLALSVGIALIAKDLAAPLVIVSAFGLFDRLVVRAFGA